MSSTAFFGQYLVTKGIIDSQQLAKSLTEQELSNKKIGELAVDQKLLDERQVREVLVLQKKEGVFFGEGAQKLGFLSQGQVDQLLVMQAKQHVCLGDVIVKLGFVTAKQRDKALQEFTQEQTKKERDPLVFSLPDGSESERSFVEKFKAHTIRVLQRMASIFAKFDCYEQVAQRVELPAFAAQVDHCNDAGAAAIRFLILIDEEVSQTIHSKICKGNNVDENEITKEESLCEMLNIFCYTGFQMFAKLTASVPMLLKPHSFYTPDEKETSLIVCLVTPYGPVKFLLSFFRKNIKPL